MRLYDESFAPGLRLSHMAARAISEKRKGDAIAAALGAVHFNPDKPESYSVLSAAYNQAHGCEEFQINAANAGLDLPVNTEDPFDTRVRATLWHNKALAENRLYRWRAAMESANKAHRLDPVNPWYLGLAANLADETADWEIGPDPAYRSHQRDGIGRQSVQRWYAGRTKVPARTIPRPLHRFPKAGRLTGLLPRL